MKFYDLFGPYPCEVMEVGLEVGSSTRPHTLTRGTWSLSCGHGCWTLTPRVVMLKMWVGKSNCEGCVVIGQTLVRPWADHWGARRKYYRRDDLKLSVRALHLGAHAEAEGNAGPTRLPSGPLCLYGLRRPRRGALSNPTKKPQRSSAAMEFYT
jgi:hypothetical protein